MELKLFATQTIFNNEENRHNPFTKYASDIDNKVFLFLNKNNSILYYNSQNSILKTIDEYKNLSLLHFIIFTDKHFICILYNNGDIIFIFTSFIESDNFDHYWSSISSMKKTITSISASKPKSPLFAEFLLCGSSSSFNIKRNLIMKNILKDFFDEQSTSISISSCVLWKNPKDNGKENLILSYDYHLMILNINDSYDIECTFHIKFDYMIYCVNLVPYNDSMEYIIIQCEKKFYHLSLYDKNSNQYIFDDRNNNQIESINFRQNSIISIQKYNGDLVICSLTQDNSFDIYSAVDLSYPIIQIDLNTKKYNLSQKEIINCYLYEKLLLVLTKQKNGYHISIINYWICNAGTSANNGSTSKIWCDMNYGLLNDFVISEQFVGNDIVKCEYNTNFNSNNNMLLYLLTGDNLFGLLSSNSNELVRNIAGILKEDFTFETLRKIELMNNGLNGRIFDCTDIIANEISKDKEIMLKLLWNSNNPVKEKAILNRVMNGFQKNKEVLNQIIDYILINRINSKEEQLYNLNNICQLYLLLFSNHQLKEICEYIRSNNIIEKVQTLCDYFIFDNDKEKELIYNPSLISNTNVRLSDSSESDDEVHFLMNDKERVLNNYKTQPFVLVSQWENYHIKSLFQKILLCAMNNIQILRGEDNKERIKIDALVKSIFYNKNKRNDIKDIIIMTLIDEDILLNERIIEDILFIKMKRIYIQANKMNELASFLYLFYKNKKSIINSNNIIEINIQELFRLIPFIDENNNKETSISTKDILTFIEKAMLPFIFKINAKAHELSNNNKCNVLSKIFNIFLLFYFLSITSNDEISSSLYKMINNYLFMFEKFSFINNKNLSQYYYILKHRMIQNNDITIKNKIEEKIKGEQYYTSFIEALKESNDTIQNLIDSHDEDIFKQKRLYDIFIKTNKV